MNNKKITYIFGGGRKKKIEYSTEFAEDMFYGYFGLNEKYDVQIMKNDEKRIIFLISENLLKKIRVTEEKINNFCK